MITESAAGVADAVIVAGYVTVPRGRFVEVRRKFVPKPSAPTGSVVIDRSLPQADETPIAATALRAPRHVSRLPSLSTMSSLTFASLMPSKDVRGSFAETSVSTTSCGPGERGGQQ
jgi:hypothetical protein